MRIEELVKNKIARKLDIINSLAGVNKEKKFEITNWSPQAGKQELAYNYMLGNDVNVVAYGGTRGTGKSEIGINGNLAAMYDLGEDYNGVYLRNKASELEEIVSRTKQALHRDGLVFRRDYFFNSQKKIFELKNGARLRFFYVDGDGLDSLQGGNITHFTLEEPQFFKKMEIIVAKIEALWRTSSNRVVPKQLWVFNPLGPSTKWLKTNFVDKGSEIITRDDNYKQVFVFAEIKDNPKLLEATPNYIKSMEKLPEFMRKAWLEGDFNITTGIIFSNIVHCMENVKDIVDNAKYHWLACDHGFVDKTAIGFFCYNEIQKKVVLYDLIYTNLQTPTELIDRILKKLNSEYFNYIMQGRYGAKGIPEMVIDSAMQNNSGLGSVANIFANHGFSLRVVKKDRSHRLIKLLDLIDNKKLLICNKLKNVEEAFLSFINKEGHSDIEDHSDDHIYDMMGYGLEWLDDALFNNKSEVKADPMSYLNMLKRINSKY